MRCKGLDSEFEYLFSTLLHIIFRVLRQPLYLLSLLLKNLHDVPIRLFDELLRFFALLVSQGEDVLKVGCLLKNLLADELVTHNRLVVNTHIAPFR